jgi:membrane fusion protein (multidrug efflux system)
MTAATEEISQQSDSSESNSLATADPRVDADLSGASAARASKNGNDRVTEIIGAPDQAARRRTISRRWIVLALVVVALAAALLLGLPRLTFMLHHVTTDDAIVNTHVTYLSSRVNGVATEVLVDDNQYVQRGTPLVRLDPGPLQITVEQRQAAMDRAKIAVDQQVAALVVARAELEQARTQVRGQLAGLRASWYLVATVQDFVRYETAGLQSAVANLGQQQANLHLAEEEFARVNNLGAANISQQEIDQKKAALLVAREQVNTAEQTVQQSRALLGLGKNEAEPSTVPSDLSQTFNGTRYAVASLEQTLSGLGIDTGKLPAQISEMKDRLLAIPEDAIVAQSPAVLAAIARVNAAQAALGGSAFDPAHPYQQPGVIAAQKDLEEAQLQLSYTQITAPISGFVTRRYVNAGTHVQEGQNLLAIRSLEQKDVWIEANFKETQLSDLRIGQAVDIYVDAYPNRIFKGRIAGFSPGTGSVMSLLPPENATGNFVKVVQRLPVRIELTEPNPMETPLFAGLSVEPEVDIVAKPTGPGAGQRLLAANLNLK